MLIYLLCKINFEDRFHSYITASFTENIGGHTSIIGENGIINLENSWNSEKNILRVSENLMKKKYKTKKNIYSLEIENISKDIIENKTESSFPGPSKKHIFFNNKLINEWIGE